MLAETQARNLKLEVDLQERRTAIRQSWLARESIASIVGAILLLLLAGTLIVAMFTGTTVVDVIANSFLLILGYFFGQSVGRDSVAKSHTQTVEG
jgi:hypothetical protein